MASLGPFARKGLWAWVRGLLEKLITHLRLGSSRVFPLTVGETPRRYRQGLSQLGEPGCLPYGFLPLLLLIPVLSGEESASPTVATEVPWLGPRPLSTWGKVSALPALIPSMRERGLGLPAWEWMCWISFLPQTWWSPAVVRWKLVLYDICSVPENLWTT